MDGQLGVHIFADDVECLLIAAGAGDTAEHLIRLALLAGALQQAGSPPQDVENVPVLTLQAHGGLSLLRIFQVIPAQLIGNVVTQPGAYELSIGLQAPHIQHGPERLEEFDEGLFHDLVEQIVVESQTCVRFRLQGGIELKELLKETGR